MTVPQEMTFEYYKKGTDELISITIPVGDYDGYSMADALASANSGDGNDPVVTWTYDPTTLKLKPSSTITVYNCADSWQVTGFDPDLSQAYNAATGYDESQVPINLTGVTQIQLKTNLSVNNLPVSGKLTGIPMTVPYGSLLTYTDYDGAQPLLVMNRQIDTIRIQLIDENGNSLLDYWPDGYAPGDYEYDKFLPPWEVVLTLEQVWEETYRKPNYHHQ